MTNQVLKRAKAEANALARAETAAKAKTSRREAAQLVREANLLLAADGFDLSFKDDEVTFVTPATKGANRVDNYQGKNYTLTDGFERKLVAVGKTSKTRTQELDFDELELVLLHAELGTDFAPEADNDREESPYLEAVKLSDFYNSEVGEDVLANVTAERRANTRRNLDATRNAGRTVSGKEAKLVKQAKRVLARTGSVPKHLAHLVLDEPTTSVEERKALEVATLAENAKRNTRNGLELSTYPVGTDFEHTYPSEAKHTATRYTRTLGFCVA